MANERDLKGEETLEKVIAVQTIRNREAAARREGGLKLTMMCNDQKLRLV